MPNPGAATGNGLPRFTGAGAATIRRRHRGLLASFVLMVVLPVCAAVYYLWFIALPQYDSRVGFSVQKEEMGSAIQILGGITELSGGGTSDTDILFKFIQSRELVRILNDRIDLVSIYTRPEDPLFSLVANPTIEDLEDHWGRKVDVFYDTATRLIEVRALAFTPEDAVRITREIYAESTRMLNDLSAIARADGTRYAREELDTAQDRLKLARQALTTFRIRSQIVDPAADVQGRMGLLNNLLAQQAAALIDLDILASNTGTNDPRYIQAQKRVEVIDNRIRAERARFGDNPAAEDERYADLVAEFEALNVDLEFAQKAYLSALAAYDSSIAEAQRKSRYLATYLAPTEAERSRYPDKFLIMVLVGGFLFSVWMIAAIVFYSLRDRR
ncbi:MAG: sugar transporter [Gemmobacter sp.]